MLDLIQFDFRLDFHRGGILHPTGTNHVSALQRTMRVEQYTAEELSYAAIHGPFQEKPFPMHISLLMVRDKPNSSKKHNIMDLSWPKGFFCQSWCGKNTYLDTYFTLHYPSLDNITEAIHNLGPDVLLYKTDISRAFRHLKIDPGEQDLLGLHHKGFPLRFS